MPEPARRHVRPTPMRCVPLAVAPVLLVLLAGCGSGPDEPASAGAASASPSSSPSASPSPSDACAPVPSGGPALASVDLDGDGTDDPVRVVPARGGCPGGLVAEVGGSPVRVPLPAGQAPVRSAFGVDLEGRAGQLLVTRQVHPRGGFQDRVHAYADGALAELRAGEQSLVPFVALDVEEHPLSVDCADGGLVVLEAVAHEPAGIVAAWDVRRTSYAVEGTTLRRTGSTEVADNVRPDQLREQYPELVRHTSFGSCRVSG